jgi:uncharacterized protein (TIGR02145 family)
MIKSRAFIVKLFLLIILIIPSVRCDKEDQPENDPCAFHMSTYNVHCLANSPASGAILKSTNVTLKWIATTQNPTYTIAFGTNKENLPVISQQTSNSFVLTNLEASTTYYWSVIAINPCKRGCITGGTFTIIPDTNLPYIVATPVPVHINTSVPVGGNVLYEGLSPVTERGVYWGTVPEPEKNGAKISLGSGLGKFSFLLEGLNQTTEYYTKAYATNNYGTLFGSEIKFTTGLSPSFESVSDIEGNKYKCIKIGNQLWMAENLKTRKFNDETPISLIIDNNTWGNYPLSSKFSWYNNDSASYNNLYGILYNGAAVSSGKLCPVGWHVPSDDEWTTLEMYLGMSEKQAVVENTRGTDEGLQMKTTSGWLEQGNGYNTSNFSGLPGGTRVPLGSFGDAGKVGIWWSSTKDPQLNFLWCRSLLYNATGVSRTDVSMQSGCNVRCIKN